MKKLYLSKKTILYAGGLITASILFLLGFFNLSVTIWTMVVISGMYIFSADLGISSGEDLTTAAEVAILSFLKMKVAILMMGMTLRVCPRCGLVVDPLEYLTYSKKDGKDLTADELSTLWHDLEMRILCKKCYKKLKMEVENGS